MNKQQILKYILEKYTDLIKTYGECNDFPTEFPEDLQKEGYITEMIKFQPGDEIIFKYKILNHWYSDEYNGTEIKITIHDKEIIEKEDFDDISNLFSMLEIN